MDNCNFQIQHGLYASLLALDTNAQRHNLDSVLVCVAYYASDVCHVTYVCHMTLHYVSNKPTYFMTNLFFFFC